MNHHKGLSTSYLGSRLSSLTIDRAIQKINHHIKENTFIKY